MNKRRPWLKTVLLLAICFGVAVLWYVDAWLTPRPEVYDLASMCKVNPDQIDYNFNSPLIDLTMRWMCVATKTPNDSTLLCHAFDLDRHGEARCQFEYRPPSGTLLGYQPRHEGYRLAHLDKQGWLIITDISFNKGTAETKKLCHYHPEQIRQVLLANEGETVVVIHELPFWALEVLNPFAPVPWGTLASPFKTYCAEVWNAGTGKLDTVASFPPTTSRRIVLSPNGKWLVQLEGTWNTTTFRPLTSVWGNRETSLDRPIEPRGIRVLSTMTGESKALAAVPPDNDCFVKDCTIVGDDILLDYQRQGTLTGNGNYSSAPTQHDDRFPSMNLITGKRIPWRFNYSFITTNWIPLLDTPGYSVMNETSPMHWPNWLSMFSNKLGFDLYQRFPRGSVWTVTCSSTGENSKSHKASFSLPTNQGEYFVHRPHPGNYLFKHLTAQDRDIFYRWKVPFTVYSPWWSRGAGLLVMLLILGCYRFVINRRQRLLHTP